MFWKKQKKIKAIWAVLGHSETKIFSVGQPWWPTFFQDLAHPSSPATILVLLWPWVRAAFRMFNLFQVKATQVRLKFCLLGFFVQLSPGHTSQLWRAKWESECGSKSQIQHGIESKLAQKMSLDKCYCVMM